MNNRNYNIYFHTHTISGIFITAFLYVIFFAGSFSFFKNEITSWQYGVSNDKNAKKNLDYNKLLDSLDRRYNLHGREVSLYLNPHASRINVNVSDSKDTVTNKAKGDFFYMDINSFATNDYNSYYNIGEFLYRLHFLAQLNEAIDLGFPLGYYIAGIVAFIFLFALLTGLLLHWQKIVSNFYLFRPWEKLKTVWTDLHTALGVISFPYLLLFAITGAYFLVGFELFSTPVVKVQYAGNQDSLFTELGYGAHNVEFQSKRLAQKPDVNSFVADARQKWSNTTINYIETVNYGDSSMEVHVGSVAKQSEKFTGSGEIVYRVADRQVLKQKDPFASSSYSDVVDNAVYVLHFGDYGGYATKVVYFLLGISSCVVIISGVLIWLVARDKKNIPGKKRKFNLWLANIYMAVCLSMLPVTAASFIAVKLNPYGGSSFIYRFYFFLWLAVATFFAVRKNIYKTNRDSLLAGGLIGLFIPLVNGIVSGNWIWNTYSKGYHDILLIDLFWIAVSAAALISYRLVVKRNNRKSSAITV